MDRARSFPHKALRACRFSLCCGRPWSALRAGATTPRACRRPQPPSPLAGGTRETNDAATAGHTHQHAGNGWLQHARSCRGHAHRSHAEDDA
eukprot:5284208-Pleurochrysis_carterae.AAC.1